MFRSHIFLLAGFFLYYLPDGVNQLAPVPQIILVCLCYLLGARAGIFTFLHQTEQPETQLGNGYQENQSEEYVVEFMLIRTSCLIGEM